MYDTHFSESELRKIRRLRALDSRTKLISITVGVSVALVVFLLQGLFQGVSIVHALCTYGSLPFGAAAGLIVGARINRHIEHQFLEVWDPLYYERSGSSPEQDAALEEINRVLDQPEFLALPERQQKKVMEQINEKYGIGRDSSN